MNILFTIYLSLSESYENPAIIECIVLFTVSLISAINFKIVLWQFLQNVDSLKPFLVVTNITMFHFLGQTYVSNACN